MLPVQPTYFQLTNQTSPSESSDQHERTEQNNKFGSMSPTCTENGSQTKRRKGLTLL